MCEFSRRDFIKAAGAGAGTMALASGLFSCKLSDEVKMRKAESKRKRHIVTLSFDDGFKKSSIKQAKIYENYGLSACINVIATGHLPQFRPPSKSLVTSPRGDFGLWNELKARGHEIMPHTYRHANLTKVPFDEAKDLVVRCLDYFSQHLEGFEPKEAVYNFAYNASTPALEKWLAAKVRAFRTGGDIINPLPSKRQVKLTCGSYGPGNCEQYLEGRIDKLLSLDEGWLIFNGHGLDGEGWGPMRSTFLQKLLERLSAIESVAILPAGKALSDD